MDKTLAHLSDAQTYIEVNLEEFWTYIKGFNFGDLTDIFENIKE